MDKRLTRQWAESEEVESLRMSTNDPFWVVFTGL